MPPLHLSRFAQLLLFSLVVLFLPTFIYLWPARGSASPLTLSSSQPSTQGNGPLDPDLYPGGSGSGGAGGGWTWPGEKWVDPARLKAGDYWKTWKDKWGSAAAEAEGKMAAAAAAAAGGAGAAAGPGPGPGAVTPASAAASAAAAAASMDAIVPPLLPVADGKAAIADKMGNATAK